jgi:hypothetical protein
MKMNLLVALITMATLGLLTSATGGVPTTPLAASGLAGTAFTLGGARSRAPQEFTLETHIVSYAPDGARGVTDIYRLRLKCIPAAVNAPAGDTFTCLAFSVQFGAEPEAEIPSLKGLTYTLDVTPNNGKDGRPALGVPHAPFENLVDAAGRPVPAGNAYHVYNAFMDFHGFCDVFPRSMGEAAGIEDLHTIGQKIVHAAAFSEAPVDVGSNVAKGSFYRNGEVTLEFKGLSVVNGTTCALLEVDSGWGSLAMTMRPAPNLEVKTTGGSHYQGDIYVNLATNWVSRVEVGEMVLAETTLPMPPNKVDTRIERAISIRNVSP